MELTNVAKARRLFPSYRQPMLPGPLGFYDLKFAESQVA